MVYSDHCWALSGVVLPRRESPVQPIAAGNANGYKQLGFIGFAEHNRPPVFNPADGPLSRR